MITNINNTQNRSLVAKFITDIYSIEWTILFSLCIILFNCK